MISTIINKRKPVSDHLIHLPIHRRILNGVFRRPQYALLQDYDLSSDPNTDTGLSEIDDPLAYSFCQSALSESSGSLEDYTFTSQGSAETEPMTNRLVIEIDEESVSSCTTWKTGNLSRRVKEKFIALTPDGFYTLVTTHYYHSYDRILDPTVSDQNEKEYSRSKRDARKIRELKEKERKIKDQRNQISDLKESQKRLKERLVAIERQKKSSEEVKDQGFKPPALPTRVGQIFFSFVDATKLSLDQYSYAHSCADPKVVDMIPEDMSYRDVVRELVAYRVATTLHSSLSFTKQQIRVRNTNHRTLYEEYFKKLPLCDDRVLTAHKGWHETLSSELSQEQLDFLDCQAKKNVPSNVASASLTAVKLTTFAMDLYHCSTWTEVLISSARMIVYTATPRMMEYLLSLTNGNLMDYMKSLTKNTDPPTTVDTIRDQNFFDDLRATIRSGIGIDDKIAEIPLANFIDQLVCLLVFFHLEHDEPLPGDIRENVIPSSRLWKDLVFRATKIHKTDTLSLISRISTVIDSAIMIFETIVTGKSYLLLVNPLNISLRLARVQGLFNSYKTGNMEVMMQDGEGMSPDSFEDEVLTLAKDVEDIVDKRMVKPAAMRAYTAYLSTAIEMKQHVLAIRKSRTLKLQPTFIGLFSEPGVGKTGLTYDFRSVLEIAFDTEILDRHIYGGSGDVNKWATGFTSATKYISVNEVGNKKSEIETAAEEYYNSARLADTTPNEMPQAEADMKGKTWNFVLGGAFCCNQQDFSLSKYVKCVGAHNRRFLNFKISCKPEFGKIPKGSYHYVPDPSKISMIDTPEGPMPNPEIYLIQEYTFCEKNMEGDVSGDSRSVWLEDVGDPMEVSTWLTYMLNTVKARNAECGAHLSNIAKKRRLPKCKNCANLENFCKCVSFVPWAIPEETSTSSLLDRLPTLEQVQFHCGRFKDFVKSQIKNLSLTENSSMDELIRTNLRDRPDLFLKEQNLAEYGLVGEVCHQASTYLFSMPIGFSLNTTYWLTRIAGVAIKTSLQQFFNFRNSVGVFFFVWFHTHAAGIAAIAFVVMFLTSSSIATTSEFLTRRLVAQRVRNGQEIKYWQKPLTVFLGGMVAVAGLYSIYSSYSTPVNEGSSDEDSEVTLADNNGLKIVTSSDLRDRMLKPDEWEKRVVYCPTAPPRVKTATVDQVFNVVSANSVMIQVPLGNIRGIMIYANTALVPIHSNELSENQCVRLHRKGCQGSVSTHVVAIRRVKTDNETDICAVVFGIRLPIRSIIDFFDHSFDHKDPTEVGGCTLFTAKPQITIPTIQSVSTTRRDFLGLSAPIQFPTMDGDCGLPLIRNSSPCVIVGLHVAIKSNTHSHCVLISKKNITAALSDVLQDQGESTIILHNNLLFDNVIETMKKPGSSEPSHRVATRWLRSKEDETAPFSVTPYGFTNDRIQSKSAVMITELSPFLDDVGLTRLHGAPPLNTNRAASKFLQLAARSGRPRPPALQKAVLNHYSSKIAMLFNLHSVKPRPLSVEEAMSGVHGNAYAKSMNLTTSSGGGYPGKKRNRVIYCWNSDERELYDLFEPEPPTFDSLVDQVPTLDDLTVGDMRSVNTENAAVGDHEPLPRPGAVLSREVIHILSELKKNNSCNAINQVALKDEPISLAKLAKGDFFGRVITSLPMAHHVVDTILFGHILSYLRTFALESGCWEGISPYSEDWAQVIAHIAEKPYVMDMDTKKMDQTQNFQDVYSVFEIFALIVEKTTADAEFAALIRARGCDLAVPILDLFGEWVAVYMNTSGNKITININDLGGVEIRALDSYAAKKVQIKYGILDMSCLVEFMDTLSEAEYSEMLMDFDDHVRVGSVGDDAVLSTDILDFDLDFISSYFKIRGVTITGASKSDDTVVGLSITDLQMCKRGVRWMSEAQRIVGPLDETSILRSLHCRLPSSEDQNVIESCCMDKALEEYMLHGRSVFDDRKGRLLEAVIKAERMGLHYETFSKTYDDYVASFLKRFPTSECTRTLSDPFLKDQNGLTNLLEARVVRQSSRLRSVPLNQGRLRLTLFVWFMCTGLIQSLHHDFWISNQNTNTTTALMEEQQQNVKLFLSDSLVDTASASHSTQPASRTVATNDSSLDMIERPVKLATIAWNTGEALFTDFNPWARMFDSDVVKSRCQHYRHFRGNLRLTVTVEGTNFHYGECWLVYNMLSRSDNFIQFAKGNTADLVEASQRPHIQIKARGSQGGELLLPFVFPRDFIDLTSSEFDALGTVSLSTIVPLATSNGLTSPCRITILGRFENVELYTPTSVRIAEIVDQNEMIIKDEPIMGGSNELAAQPGGVSTSPGVAWDSSVQTSFASLGGRETYIGSSIWNVSDAPDRLLLNLRCSPFHGITTGAAILAEHHVTPSAYVGLPFTYWRGTCQYRFEVICSSMHRGKLRVVYDPCYSNREQEYNLNYSSIFDVGSNTEHVAKIGWSQNTSYLPTINGMSQIVNFSKTKYSSTVNYANGVLALYVHSNLISPSPDFGSSVTINVYAKMMPDYELVLPREPLAGTKPQSKNFPPRIVVTETNNTENPQEQTPARPLNTNLVSARSLVLCEAPALTFATISSVFILPDGGITNNNTLEASQSDDNFERAITSANTTVRIDPFDPKLGVSFEVTDFTEGPQFVTSRVFDSRDNIAFEQVTNLTGITDVENIDFDFSLDAFDNIQLINKFTFESQSRFRISKIRLQVPKFRFVTLTPTASPTTGAIPLFWTWKDGSVTLPPTNTVTGPVTGTFILGARDNVPIDPSRLIGNVVMQYESTGLAVYKVNGVVVTALPQSSPAQARMVGFKFSPRGVFEVISGSFTITRMRWYEVDDTAIRAAIKDQNELMSTEEFYGPRQVPGISHDFFHDVYSDVRQVMGTYHSHRAISSNANFTGGSTQNRLGITRTALPHFPTNDFLIPTGAAEYLSYNVYYNHYVAYFMRMFACVRGSMDVQIVDTGFFSPRKVIWAILTRTRGITPSSVPVVVPQGYLPTQMPVSGCQYMNLSLLGVSEATLPWYNSERFGYARSTNPDSQSPFHYTLTVGCAKETPVTINYKTGKDFSLSHFISTPILTS